MKLIAFLACLSLSLPAIAQSVSSSPPLAAATQSAPPALASSTAQKLYAAAQNDLLQLRVLLKNGHSQASVGSGFLIGSSNLVITNFHVVSQIALEPEIYFGEFKDTQGKSGELELLAVDVQHDLAVVRINRQGTGVFNLPENLAPLTQGEHLYSLGNPLDLGFTISEGTYNGITRRGFSDQIMFTGPVNSGMSGGPNVTADGQVAGVNVAHRRDGELVSFLVPARYAQQLLNSVIAESLPPADFKPIISQQLLAHQSLMMDKLLESPFTSKKLGPYKVPVRESEQLRCWGSSDAKADKTYSTNQINCSMESEIFVSEDLQTGSIAMHHQFISSTKLNSLRFSLLMGKFFSNGIRSNTKDKTLTTARCSEDFINNKNFTTRAVVCVEAYQKFEGLYDFTLMTASSDEPLMSLQSSLELNGVSYENGQKFVKEFLASFDKERRE
ncbi:MAG TPA: serine protease [Cellvibrio sp.]|nr:serine protease [Cellvibrio sp.]